MEKETRLTHTYTHTHTHTHTQEAGDIYWKVVNDNESQSLSV